MMRGRNGGKWLCGLIPATTSVFWLLLVCTTVVTTMTTTTSTPFPTSLCMNLRPPWAVLECGARGATYAYLNILVDVLGFCFSTRVYDMARHRISMAFVVFTGDLRSPVLHTCTSASHVRQY
ncbi:hypothetical protein BDQ17DRAFT_767620 [Cyathus striatus]|nr:hypothetical protein BDQ17DRAFT_767620 [Cyathus striatus]